MKLSALLPKLFICVFLVVGGSSFAQLPQEKILGNWKLEKFEFEKPSRDSQRIEKELENVTIRFDRDCVIISKMKNGVEQFIKSGSYSIDGDKLTLGKDQAPVLLLNSEQLKIKVPGQGVLYFLKI